MAGRDSERASSEPQTATVAGRGFGIAYAYLNRRERTVAEVRGRLQRAEIGDDEIEAVLSELCEFGYLDDARYARVFTQDKRSLELWGNARIARALRERGVAADLIEPALAEAPLPTDEPDGGDAEQAPEAESELQRAVTLLKRRFPNGVSSPRDRERAFGVLVRKGYESEIAADAVRKWARQAEL